MRLGKKKAHTTYIVPESVLNLRRFACNGGEILQVASTGDRGLARAAEIHVVPDNVNTHKLKDDRLAPSPIIRIESHSRRHKSLAIFPLSAPLRSRFTVNGSALLRSLNQIQ